MSAKFCACLAFLLCCVSGGAQEDYLALDAKQAEEIALSTRVKGQVGKSFDLRIKSTDRSYNYKLRATWMTPEVIRANARLLQLSNRLSAQETAALVSEAERVEGTVVLVEIDPREGSGVIPRDWQAVLQVRDGDPSRGVKGTESTSSLRDVQALTSAARRDYSYDVFWVVFPLAAADGKPLFAAGDQEAELVVQIYNKVGKVRWNIPESVRGLTAATE